MTSTPACSMASSCRGRAATPTPGASWPRVLDQTPDLQRRPRGARQHRLVERRLHRAEADRRRRPDAPPRRRRVDAAGRPRPRRARPAARGPPGRADAVVAGARASAGAVAQEPSRRQPPAVEPDDGLRRRSLLGRSDTVGRVHDVVQPADAGRQRHRPGQPRRALRAVGPAVRSGDVPELPARHLRLRQRRVRQGRPALSGLPGGHRPLSVARRRLGSVGRVPPPRPSPPPPTSTSAR